MKKLLIGLIFILTTSIIPSSGLNSQTQSIDINGPHYDVKTTNTSDRYSMRLDFMTESQIDAVIQSGVIGLDELCSYTMGCKSRKDIVLNEGDKIQLFKDDRIKSVELIKIESGKKTTIASATNTVAQSFILVPQTISRENIDSYMLLILK